MHPTAETATASATFVFLVTALATRHLGMALLITLLAVALAVAYTRGGLGRLWGWLAALWRAWRTRDAEVKRPYDIDLGRDVDSGARVVVNLEDLGHVGLYSQTRFGKTTLLHAWLHRLIGEHAPTELRLLISDPKTVDYPFYGALPHLAQPIARDARETMLIIQWMLAEMRHRAGLFGVYGSSHICNNLARYAELSGTLLPRIVAVFDELADVVEPGGQLEADLIRLAKKGLAYGIHLVCATQRPSSGVMSGEIKSQFATKLVGYMPDNREYGVVAQVPKVWYERMQPRPGRFIVYTPARQWLMVQGDKIGDRALEARARRYSGRPRRWETAQGETAVSEPRNLRTGTQQEKDTAVLEWFRTLDQRPTYDEFCDYWNCSRGTAGSYIQRLWQE